MSEEHQAVECEGEYQLGFAMSGAISAGAYTAGVLDFFIQALDEWEDAREQKDVPGHRTVIKVIAGASAGAMTGALGVTGLSDQQDPEKFLTTKPGQQSCKCHLPSLYKTWVEFPDMLPKASRPGLLSVMDLNQNEDVISLLDTTLLEEIRKFALTRLGCIARKRKYIARNLHVYMTITNMRGVPYEIKFQQGGHGMMMHSDRVHYVINGIGDWDSPSPFGDQDQIACHLNTDNKSPTHSNWVQYANFALASGAFPIGLSAREIKLTYGDYNGRKWPVQEAVDYDQHPISPNWPHKNGANPSTDTPYNFVAVDGGVFNNDPMEFARFTLRQNIKEPNERGAADADRSVIMITPFPEPPAFSESNETTLRLMKVLAALFPTLKNQGRFKLSELILANETSVYSRYMIAPKRSDREFTAPLHLASGLLQGFGGFLWEKFRDHDFQLGRRNCQNFLRETLLLEKDNKLTKRCMVKYGNAGLKSEKLPVIPLCGAADPEIPLPEWPRITLREIEEIFPLLKQRISIIGERFIKRHVSAGFTRFILRTYVRWQRKSTLRLIKWTILSELIERDQIEEWSVEKWKSPQELDTTWNIKPAQISKVWGALASPLYDYRTTASIAEVTGIDAIAVKRIIERCAETPANNNFKVVTFDGEKGETLYAFAIKAREVPLVWRLPLIHRIWVLRTILRWFVPLKLDTPEPVQKSAKHGSPDCIPRHA